MFVTVFHDNRSRDSAGSGPDSRNARGQPLHESSVHFARLLLRHPVARSNCLFREVAAVIVHWLGQPGMSAFEYVVVTGVEKSQLCQRRTRYWTVGLGGSSFRLKDSKGFAYLAHLLRYPGTEFHALGLIGGIASRSGDDEATQGLPRGDEDLEKAGIHISNLGDAGELLDDQAKADYRRRLSELREELREAKQVGRVGRAEQIEAEIEALARELSRAVGLS
jgi:uncharacterized membrane protein